MLTYCASASYHHSREVHISLLGVPHIARILLREILLLAGTMPNILGCKVESGGITIESGGTGEIADVGVSACGDPRSNAAIKSFAFSSSVGSPACMH